MVTKAPTSDAIERLARQIVDEQGGRCHRQALWCSTHTDVWPSGQTGGCNTYITAIEAATALIASAHRG